MAEPTVGASISIEHALAGLNRVRDLEAQRAPDGLREVVSEFSRLTPELRDLLADTRNTHEDPGRLSSVFEVYDRDASYFVEKCTHDRPRTGYWYAARHLVEDAEDFLAVLSRRPDLIR